MKKTHSVTIGIAAHNEEKGIQKLLLQLLSQITTTCRIDRIIVRCDGCTDNTVINVSEVMKKNSVITLIDDEHRIGLAASLNDICHKNQSDILILLDADCTLNDQYVVEKIASQFISPHVGIVSGNALPTKGSTLVQRIAHQWIMFWYLCRKDYLAGDNVNNHFGVISALHKKIAMNMNIPSDIIGVPDYIYFFGKSMGYTYVFVEDAKVFYQPAANLKDYLHQTARHHGSKDAIVQIFGASISSSYIIPNHVKRRAIFKSLFISPIIFPLSCLLQIYLRAFQHKYEKKSKDGLWDIISTTK